MSVGTIEHVTEGLAVPCNANHLILVTGGLQCGNCLAHNVQMPVDDRPRCTAICSDDVRCSVRVEDDGELCWVHKAQAAHVE
jgi:hypothetical protein